MPDPVFDASKPHISRVYDYLLGGKDNFAADRAVADQIIAQLPAVQVGVRAQRDLLGRVVRYLVGEAGLRQLLDIGSGLPTAENVHEIAHTIDPATRVVYLDNDPVVLAHARALLADDKVTFAVDGDLRDPAGLLAHPEVREYLDWDQPIGLLLCGILHYILDEENPAQVVETLYRALPRVATCSSTTAGQRGSRLRHLAIGHAEGPGPDAVPDVRADPGAVRRAGAGRARRGARARLAP